MNTLIEDEIPQVVAITPGNLAKRKTFKSMSKAKKSNHISQKELDKIDEKQRRILNAEGARNALSMLYIQYD